LLPSGDFIVRYTPECIEITFRLFVRQFPREKCNTAITIIITTNVDVIWIILSLTVTPLIYQGRRSFSDNSYPQLGWTPFILNQELYIKNVYSGITSFNIMTYWSRWSWWTTLSHVIRC
jgi:hypothetical protein